MDFGFVIEGGDAATIVQLGRVAEDAGWDGVFIADAMNIETEKVPAFPWFDPWVTLAAMAVSTERIRIGTLITPVSRRRPWKLARETVTVDHLSNGRLTLGVGLGAAEDDTGFHKVGEAMDLRVRAQLLDEGLAILDGLWKGKPFSFDGEHFRVGRMTMLPRPVQSPRIPVWVVGVLNKPKSMERVLSWDGIIPQKYRSYDRPTPDDVRDIRRFVDGNRSRKTRFDIVVGGSTPGNKPAQAARAVAPFAEAGATWWLESLTAGSPAKVRRRIEQGPPRAG